MNTLNKYALLILLLSIFSAVNSAYAANPKPQMVLVSASTTPIFSPRELRRFYLGAPIKKQGRLLIPIQNKSDSLLYEVFLQKVISMSSSRYERFLIKRVYRGAGSSPRRITKAKKLAELLLLRDNTVSFMWESEAKKIAGIKIIQPLW